MPLKDLLGSSHGQPYAASDPCNLKSYYKVVHDSAKVSEAAQDRRMSEAYAAGKLKRSYYQPPSDGEEGGVARRSAVEARAREHKILGVISRNDSLYFATVSGWTHKKCWRPSAEDEAERLRRERYGEAVQTEMELEMDIYFEMGRAEYSRARDRRARSGRRRALGIKSRALSLVRPGPQKNDPQTLIDESHERCIIANE